MKYLITAFIFLLSIPMSGQLNQIDSNGLKQGRWVKSYEGGKKRYEGNFVDDIPVGHFIYYYEREGGIMSEIYYRAKSGIGLAKAYHRNGVIQAEGVYIGQEKDSIWTYYDPKGNLTQRENYKHGLLNGDQTTYYENGKIAERIAFEEGVEHGIWLRKWEDGTLRTKGEYVNGLLEGECKYFDGEGKIVAKGEYHNNLKHNTWTYFEDNKVVRKEEYKYGKLERETVYDESEE